MQHLHPDDRPRDSAAKRHEYESSWPALLNLAAPHEDRVLDDDRLVFRFLHVLTATFFTIALMATLLPTGVSMAMAFLAFPIPYTLFVSRRAEPLSGWVWAFWGLWALALFVAFLKI